MCTMPLLAMRPPAMTAAGCRSAARRAATVAVAAIVAAIVAMSVMSVMSASANGPRVSPSRSLRAAAEPAAVHVDFTRDAGAMRDTRIATRVCEHGARWLRPGFSSLRLAPGDSLLVVGSGGDSLRLRAQHARGGPFEMRALRGACVDLVPDFAHADSRYALRGYTFGRLPLASSPMVVAAAGDLCGNPSDGCRATAEALDAIAPDAVIVLGDNAYPYGSLSEYTAQYAPHWGRFRAITRPVPGNHEYLTSGASGYYDYFNGIGAFSGPAGDRDKGYYSWDIGEWHFVALNSNFPIGSVVEERQLEWLRADLAANTRPCTAAYFHHPFLSRGNYRGEDRMKPYWDALYAAHADLVLNGHDHNYQRYARMNPLRLPAADGIRQLIVGTGGYVPYPISGTHPLLEVGHSGGHGVLRLTLHAGGYEGEFVPAAGSAFRDTFSGVCNRAMPPDGWAIATCRLPPVPVTPGMSTVPPSSLPAGLPGIEPIDALLRRLPRGAARP